MKISLFLLSFALLLGSQNMDSQSIGSQSMGFQSQAAGGDHDRHFDAGEKLGKVAFPTSCPASAQKSFERGVALLHSFAYEEAGRQFQEIERSGSHCAMAYWGEAMSLYHQLWDRPSQPNLKHGWELLEKARAMGGTRRELDYIGALAVFYRGYDTLDHEKRAAAYPRAMEKVYRRYPADREAAVFYALSLLSWPQEDTWQADAKQAISILSRLFKLEPDHPGVAHYLIHACDNPQFASMGLAAARRYAGIAPSSPHALHMPSHIFARLGLWQDDIQSNLAAIEAAKKQESLLHIHTLHHQLHSMDFMEYAYLQTGDDNQAAALLEQLAAIHKEDLDEEFAGYLEGWRASFSALYALEMHRWNDALNLQPLAGAEPDVQAVTYWARAIAAGHLHNAEAARAAVDQYEVLMAAASHGKDPYKAGPMHRFRNEAAAWLAFTEGKNDDALNLLRPIAARQDAVGKGEVELPAREMMADMLLEMDRPQEALAEYEKSLHTDPNRFNGLYGAARAAEAVHESGKAAGYYAQLLKNCDNGAHSGRPELVRAKTLLAQK